MRRIKAITAIILLFSLVSVTACTSDSGQQNETPQATPAAEQQVKNTPDSDNQKIPVQTGLSSREEKINALQAMIPAGLTKIPETSEEFTSTPPGKYGGFEFGEHAEEIESILKKFPDIDNPDEEIIHTYFLALLGLFGEDYPDPQQIIDEIKLTSFGNPEIDDPRFQFKDQYNVEIILDASGSMAAKVGGKTRMEAAKEAINSFAESLPKQAHVALRVYGHKGSGKESDKALSCGSSELVYQMQAYDAQKLKSALDQFQPTGYTPIAHSLQEAQKDLSSLPGAKNTNIIFLVSDGIETCDGDPVAVAKQLAESDITPIVNVIGFGVDGEGQQQLKAVANAAGGRYVHIRNQDELKREFEKSEKIAHKWQEWKSNASYDASSSHISRSVDIGVFALDWKRIAQNESYNLHSAIMDLRYRDTLADDTVDALDKLTEEHQELSRTRAEELEQFLQSINDKTYKDAIKEINDKYNSNVKTN